MAERLQESELAALARLLHRSVDDCREFVTAEEWAEYKRCRDSVIEARRYAEFNLTERTAPCAT